MANALTICRIVLSLALPFMDVATPAIPVCAIALFAAVQEGHFMRTGKTESPA